MHRIPARLRQSAHLFALAALGGVQLILSALPLPVRAQIFLSPNQQLPQRSRTTLDLGGGVRCSSEGGSVPSLSMGIGAYPDLLVNDIQIDSNSATTGGQSKLFALISVNIPLAATTDRFSCNELLKDTQIRARIQSLRELLDDDIITEASYRTAVRKVYESLAGRIDDQPEKSAAPQGSMVVIPAAP